MSDKSTLVRDPVCGKEVDTLRARAVGIFGGVTYYFCSSECKSRYKDPRKTPREPATEAAGGEQPERERRRRNTLENWDVVAGGAQPQPPSDDLPKEEVRYARSKPKRQAEPETTGSQTAIEASDDEQPAKTSWAWLVALVLFALGGVTLYFALKR